MDQNEPSTSDDHRLQMDSEIATHEDHGLNVDTVPGTHDDFGVSSTAHDHSLFENLSDNENVPRQIQESRMHLCINCNVDTRRLRRHTLELVEVRSLIQQWLTPVQVTSNNVLCHPCWTLAWNAIRGVQPFNRDQLLGHIHICVNCGRSLNRMRTHRLHTERHIRRIIEEWIMPQTIRGTDEICHPCWQRASRLAPRASTPNTSNRSISEESTTEGDEIHITSGPETITLPNYIRVPITQQHCFYPGCIREERLAVPSSLRARLFCDYNVYVSPQCRICRHHLYHTSGDILTQVENPVHTFNSIQIEDYTSLLKQQMQYYIDFEDIENMEEHLVHYWFGFSKEQINILISEVPRLRDMHRGPFALAAFLLKLRTGDSNERISSLLKTSRRTVERLMSQAREILHQDFVQTNLGIHNITREEISNRNLLIPNGLFGGENRKPIVILDGTYIYVQKSANYLYQKNTYSLHKYRNLVKPFLIVCSDGYIVDVLGPYPATTSDADIIRSEFNNEQNPFRQYFQADDVFILDRGFRDSVQLLRECGYSVHLPSFLQEGETQLSTAEANKTRTVTICRWVVEIVNGIFKHSFKIFRQEFFNRASKHIMKDFAIAAALINRFHLRIRDRDDANEILNRIHSHINVNNDLADFIDANNVNRRRTQFININVGSDNLTEFPQLSYSELVLFACGTYQLKQARSYYGEHMRAQGSYAVEVSTDRDNSILQGYPSAENLVLVRGRIKSRHVSRKIYFVYILIKPDLHGLEAIEQYCCNCISGRRTVGCCAHVMTLVWYMGWARYQTNINPPAEFLDDVLIVYDEE